VAIPERLLLPLLHISKGSLGPNPVASPTLPGQTATVESEAQEKKRQKKELNR